MKVPASSRSSRSARPTAPATLDSDRVTSIAALKKVEGLPDQNTAVKAAAAASSPLPITVTAVFSALQQSDRRASFVLGQAHNKRPGLGGPNQPPSLRAALPPNGGPRQPWGGRKTPETRREHRGAGTRFPSTSEPAQTDAPPLRHHLSFDDRGCRALWSMDKITRAASTMTAGSRRSTRVKA